MKLLIDTHALLDLIAGQPLPDGPRRAFLDDRNLLYVSAASYWELCIKLSLGKLTLASRWWVILDNEMQLNGIVWLPIERSHCQRVIELPFHHRDPFDRMLIAQAQYEDMTLLTADANMRLYDVPVIW